MKKLNKDGVKMFFVYIIITLIVLNLFYLVLLLSEVINVGVLGNIQGYPWGCKCFDGMEHYLNPQTYTATLLIGACKGTALIFFLYWLGSYLYRSSKKQKI